MSERNPAFLQTKYRDLSSSEEVTKIAVNTETKTGAKVSEKPEARIQNYLDYISNSIDPNNPRREEKLARFKQSLYDGHIIKPAEVPEAYFNTQRRLAREQGHGDMEIGKEQRKQLIEVIITDQKSSLDNWVDYMASPDAVYPDWLKYWAMRSILGMGEYDKEKKQFGKRRKDTVKSFPDLDREALAYVLDAVEKKYRPQVETQLAKEKEEEIELTEADLEEITLEEATTIEDEQHTKKQEQQAFKKLLQGESFAKLYAWAIEKVTPASQEQLADTRGEWIKYPKGSDHTPLVQSLQGHGTGWCTAGESTARTQLDGGDFYVFYSLDPKGKPTVPRAAIRMQENSIAEVRGVFGQDQNLDPHIGTVVQDKLKEFPDGKLYEKKNADMKHLTVIENKMKKEQELSRADLVFFYALNSPIQGFGYKPDPRIQELRQQRDPKADAPVCFDCEPDQIAHTQSEVNENTKAYVGQLFPNIFQQLKDLEYVYTAFPEGKIVRSTIEIGGKTKNELVAEMKGKNIQISGYAQSILDSKDFITAKKSEPTDLVRLKVGDLGLEGNPTTDQIYQKIKELGLELCPAEVGPQYRLQYADQPTDEYLYIGMKQIAGSGGYPDVFGLRRGDAGLWLDVDWAEPARRWSSVAQFVFRLRK
ncbi:hypothetical protein A2316_00950 [Candidatus Falkowbacteria bacterium RIFOXYB2_FULL_38_15]|uniref:Uncharacterized protein n=1 Tax=Candidatus Falkowbacteria bacterium RIFOXYA2_FULL_38_12 TaxID=1797993 RepID=A0A1F5S4I7_9BACT|nr:MAG: hypothetical protein A2257_02355 [Candidatus Falkowbacteria bacterium RIFOXYA2_FULL_38_12]OGF32761.1 MAG: hypothetical protein A2316_00950 [Candidatus Falkowbacteria bacterium RIFOXYB2_FULL_38_15]OGF42203.1 MAG: hypothetical protein A2555_02945 [Candidatus Falkowbacteria bacterium RIFOXYD2_FULL_39_16]